MQGNSKVKWINLLAQRSTSLHSDALRVNKFPCIPFALGTRCTVLVFSIHFLPHFRDVSGNVESCVLKWKRHSINNVTFVVFSSLLCQSNERKKNLFCSFQAYSIFTKLFSTNKNWFRKVYWVSVVVNKFFPLFFDLRRENASKYFICQYAEKV